MKDLYRLHRVEEILDSWRASTSDDTPAGYTVVTSYTFLHFFVVSGLLRKWRRTRWSSSAQAWRMRWWVSFQLFHFLVFSYHLLLACKCTSVCKYCVKEEWVSVRWVQLFFVFCCCCCSKGSRLCLLQMDISQWSVVFLQQNCRLHRWYLPKGKGTIACQGIY